MSIYQYGERSIDCQLRNPGSQHLFFDFDTPHGNMLTSYHPDDGDYCIASIDTWRSRQGIGKDLLRTARQHAIELGARVIVAGIISEECLASMTAVFGDESLKVNRHGEYRSQLPDGVEPRPAIAILTHYLAD